jgi:alkaline phosphatase
MKHLRFTALILAALSLIIATGGCVNTEESSHDNQEVNNIILFIGDGMGVAHLTAAITVSGAQLNMISMPYAGLVKTSASDKYITDSAAAGTALATGVKTRSGMIGMGPDSIPLSSIINIAHNHGLSTGVISTSDITHATPAAFVAHNISRRNQDEIAVDFLNGKIDLFMGGGLRRFNNREDGQDLTVRLREMGYAIATTPADLASLDQLPVAGLFSDGHLPMASEGRPVSLAMMTSKSIELLSKNKKGFFLMIESSMIDWGGHDHDTDYILSETLDMDNALGVALTYAESNPNTLVIVTSDHETGGMILTGGSISERRVVAEYITTGHSAEMVPLLASGAGAASFSGIMENIEVFERMIVALGLFH